MERDAGTGQRENGSELEEEWFSVRKSGSGIEGDGSGLDGECFRVRRRMLQSYDEIGVELGEWLMGQERGVLSQKENGSRIEKDRFRARRRMVLS